MGVWGGADVAGNDRLCSILTPAKCPYVSKTLGLGVESLRFQQLKRVPQFTAYILISHLL